MSIYSNLAASTAEERSAYVTAVLELLGDQDPVAVLSGTPSWCRERVDYFAARGRLATPEAAGKWSAAGVIQHLADSELVWGYRLRKVLAEDRPELTGFDQDLWAERLGYANADAEQALAVFSTLRRANLGLLARASHADWERVGVHNERGEESVRHMMRLYAGHDLVHRRQMERIARSVSGGATPAASGQ